MKKPSKPVERPVTPVKKVEKTSSKSYKSVFLLSALFFGLSFYLSSKSPSQSVGTKRINCDEDSWGLNHLNYTNIPRFQWVDDISFSKQIASWREPVILTSTFVKHWKALHRWDNDTYLREQLGDMKECMIADECMVLSGSEDSQMVKEGLEFKNNFVNRDMLSDEFFQHFNQPHEEKYWYWYGQVPQHLKEDVHPHEFLWVDLEDEKAFGLFMWLSDPYIGPWLHYDQDHNFYVQVSGTKRFIMFPPWEYEHIYAFPRIHPFWHKSQVNFDHPDLEKHPEFAKAQGYVADLKQGDILYIPPYWWHHVRSKERSVSLASWSQSGVFKKMRYDLYEREFTFDREEGEKKKEWMVYFIKELIREVYPDVSEFFKKMYSLRWEPLGIKSMKRDDICQYVVVKNDGWDERIKEDVQYAVEAFSNCQYVPGDTEQSIGPNRRDMMAIRNVEMMEFIEVLLVDVIGAMNVSTFIEMCLMK